MPYNSDTKIRIRLPSHVRFYYPDASVVCEPNPETDSFQDSAVVIVEVLSPGTRRLDEGEKKDAYLTIPSLRVYVLIDQEKPTAVVFRRAGEGFGGFAPELFEGLQAVIPLPEIQIEVPLTEVYHAVEFAAESDGGD